jgi:hypothetical protein
MKGKSVAGEANGDRFFGALSKLMNKEGLSYNSELKRDRKQSVNQFLSQELDDGGSSHRRIRVARALQNR